MTERISLKINGKVFENWTRAEITRGLGSVCAQASFDVVYDPTWNILPPLPCTVSAGDDLLITGYIAATSISMDDSSHQATITVRSKTQDLVDCVSELPLQEVNGFDLYIVASRMAEPFDIAVINKAVEITPTAKSAAYTSAAYLSLDETVFGYIERLARLKGVLLTDNPAGELVLTNAGAAESSSALILGQNVISANVMHDWTQRFSKYMSRTQHGLDGANARVGTQIIDYVLDEAVTRYRPTALTTEQEVTGVTNLDRVTWQRSYSIGQSKKVSITVPGWREDTGVLYTPNTMMTVQLQPLGIEYETLLLVDVRYVYDEQGFRTELMLGPVQGYIPDPAQLSGEPVFLPSQAKGQSQVPAHQQPGIIPSSSRLASINKNPGNLRYAGQTGAVPGAGGFAQFPTPEAGTVALSKQISLDASRNLTLGQFIHKFAPPSENNTASYVSFMTGRLNVSANTPLKDIPNQAVTSAVAFRESGTIVPST